MTIYDNLALPPGPNGAPIGNGNIGMGIPGLGPLADSFLTTSAGTLSDVQLELQLMGIPTGQITAYLYSSVAGSPPVPGSSLYTLGTILDSSVSNNGTIIDLSGLSYSLAATLSTGFIWPIRAPRLARIARGRAGVVLQRRPMGESALPGSTTSRTERCHSRSRMIRTPSTVRARIR